MPQNISKKPRQDQLEALTYGAGAQFDPHPYNYATLKDLELELRSEDKHSGQPSKLTKANDKARRQPGNEEAQSRHSHGGVKKPKHDGHNSRTTAPPNPFPRLEREGDQGIATKASGAAKCGALDTSSKEAPRKNASSLGYISGNDYEGEI